MKNLPLLSVKKNYRFLDLPFNGGSFINYGRRNLMAQYSQYKNLELPNSPERYNIQVFNKNAMVIDSELHKLDMKNQSQDELLATKEALNSETTRATTKENEIESDLASEIARAKSAENYNANNIANEISRAMTEDENISTALQEHILDELNPHHVTKEQAGLGNVDNTSDIDKPVSTAQQNALDLALSTHNTSDSSHNDMRLLISGLTSRLNALADSDDTTLDQLSEIVAYIKNNKSLIDGITTSKVNVSDIIDDLTTNSGDKPLSSKQGTILKEMIVSLTKEDIGLGNVENKSSATIREELTKENITNALGYTPPTSNTTYGVVSATANGLMDKSDKVKLDNLNIAYATCDTEATVSSKIITISSNQNWQLKAGAIICVKYSITNTASNCTLNVNNTGSKQVWFNNAVNTGSSNMVFGYANRHVWYIYDGTYWVWMGHGTDINTTYSNASLGQGYGTCSTAQATTAKVVTLSSYALVVNGIVAVKFTYAVPASATMNINSKGAKAIYYKGKAITAGIINAGDIAVFIYNGSQYHLLAIDSFNSNTSGNNSIVYSDTEPTSLIDGMTWVGK